MLAANSVLAPAYDQLINGKFAWYPHAKLSSVHYIVNDGLMAVFFFVVGLEVKRELVCGTYANGWAIPAATDIAFAMGILGILGNRVPASLRLFLLTVAIVDDMGAVMVIALFYTPEVSLFWLGASAAVFGLMAYLNHIHVSRFLPYIALAFVLWWCFLNSGVHATIAGVLAALTIPMHRKDGNSMLERLEHGLAPWSAYLVVPVFGFANAGVSFGDMTLNNLLDPLPVAIAAGLVFGKQVGIFSAIWIAEKVGFAPRPEHASWQEIWGWAMWCCVSQPSIHPKSRT